MLEREPASERDCIFNRGAQVVGVRYIKERKAVLSMARKSDCSSRLPVRIDMAVRGSRQWQIGSSPHGSN